MLQQYRHGNIEESCSLPPPKKDDELKIQVEHLENEITIMKREFNEGQIILQERLHLAQKRLNSTQKSLDLAQEESISDKEKIKELQQIRELDNRHIKQLEIHCLNSLMKKNRESKEVYDQLQVEKDVPKVLQQFEKGSRQLFQNEQRNLQVNQEKSLGTPISTGQIWDNLSQAKAVIQGPIQDLIKQLLYSKESSKPIQDQISQSDQSFEDQINQAVQQGLLEKYELNALVVDKQKLEQKVLELEGLLQDNKENQAVQYRLQEKQELELVDKQKLEEKVLELEGLLQVNKENLAVQQRLMEKQELDLVDKQKLEETILELEGFLQDKEEKFQEDFINLNKYKVQLQEKTEESKKNIEEASCELNKLKVLLEEQSLTFYEEKNTYINEAQSEAIKITEENEKLLSNQQAKHIEQIKDHEIQFQLKIEQQLKSNDILQKNQLKNKFELLTKISSRIIVDEKQMAILSHDFKNVQFISLDYSVTKVIELRDQKNQSDFGETSIQKQIKDYHLALSKDHLGVVITWNNNMNRNIFSCDCKY